MLSESSKVLCLTSAAVQVFIFFSAYLLYTYKDINSIIFVIQSKYFSYTVMCLFYWQTHALLASRIADVPPTHIVAKVQLKLLLLHYGDVAKTIIVNWLTFTSHTHYFLCLGPHNLLTYLLTQKGQSPQPLTKQPSDFPHFDLFLPTRTNNCLHAVSACACHIKLYSMLVSLASVI